MNTKQQAFAALVSATRAVFGPDRPEITGGTHVGALALGRDQIDGFAQIVSDSLALLAVSEQEVTAILETENARSFPKDGVSPQPDERAMTMDQLAQRIAELPYHED